MPRLVVIVLVLVVVLVLEIERLLGLCAQNDLEREPGLLQKRWARTNRFEDDDEDEYDRCGTPSPSS